MPRNLIPLREGDIIDWNGTILSKKILKYLAPGCLVRIGITDGEKSEMLYFKIIKQKDGTFWGSMVDNCHRFTPLDIIEDQIFTFRAENINEIPIGHQPKWFQKKVAFNKSLNKKGYFMSGFR